LGKAQGKTIRVKRKEESIIALTVFAWGGHMPEAKMRAVVLNICNAFSYRCGETF